MVTAAIGHLLLCCVKSWPTYDKVDLGMPVAHFWNDDHQQVYSFAVDQA